MKKIHPEDSTKPKLLIIELDYHAEVLTAICPVLSEKFTLILWTTNKIWGRAQLTSNLFDNIIITPKKISSPKVWLEHEHLIKTADLIYFNTLERNTSFFHAVKFPCPVIIRIHNMNASLFPVNSIDWSFFKLPKIAIYCIRKTLLYDTWRTRKQLLLKADLLMLPSLPIKKKAQSKLTSLGFNNIADYCLPFFSLGSATNLTQENKEIIIGITGSIDPTRKEYNDLLASINIFKERQPKEQLRLIFLGSPKGKSGLNIIRKFQDLENENFKIEYYLSYVPQEEVTRKLQEVQFLVAPIRLKSRHKIHKEYYGETKVSGIECDIVNFRKPAILPQGYHMPERLQPVIRHFDNPDNLYLSIIHYGINQEYKKAEKAFEKMDVYTKEKISEDFYQLYRLLKSHK